MADEQLPAGFEPVAQDVPAGFEPVTGGDNTASDVPAGFQPLEDKGVLGSAFEGVKQAFRRQASTAGGGIDAPPDPSIEAAQPLEFGTMPDMGTVDKLAYRVGESVPNVTTAVLAGAAGTELGGPALGIAAGALGSAGEAAMETLGPAFQAELQKTPNDPDGAYERALKTTANSGAWSAAGWIAGVPFFKGPIKNVLFQTFGVQPVVAGGQQATQNILDGKPVSDNVLQAAGEGAVTGIPIVAGHAALSKVTTGKFFPEPQTPLVDPTDLPPGFEALDGQSAGTTNVPEQPAMRPPGPPTQQMGDPSILASLPEDLSSLATQATDAGTNFDQAQASLRNTKFNANNQPGAGSKISKPNDQQPPITPDEAAYNNAVLQQKDNLRANAVGDLRMQVSGPDRPTQDRTAPPDIPARFDVAEATPAIEEQIARVRGQIEKDPYYVAKRQNELDTNIPRYVLGDGSDYTLHNATDLEEQIALQGAQKEFPTVHKVDLGSLDPSKITAGLKDLPPRANDRRVNLGQATAEMYAQMLMEPDPSRKMGMYHELVDNYGLRVVPNPGKSFTYTGGFTGERISSLPKSQRMDHILVFSRDGTPVFKTPDMHDAIQEFSDWGTLDGTTTDMKDFISGDPQRIYGLKGTPEQVKRWGDAAASGNFKELLKLHKEGISAPANPKVDRVLVPVKGIKSSDIIPAYQPMPFSQQRLNAGQFAEKDPQVGVHIVGHESISGAIPERIAKAQRIAEVLRDIQPVIDDIFKAIGAKNRPIFVVDLQAYRSGKPPGPYADITEASVHIPVDFDTMQIPGGPLTGTMEHMLQQIVYHEIGHIITFRAWDRTPAEMKAQVMQGYQRARLAWNLTKEGHASSLSLLGNPGHQNHMYYLTFVEYLAEQFRRWANQSQRVLDNTDRFFKKGASDLKLAYDMLDAKWGKQAREQMFQPAWEFNSWMDYVEQAARLGQSPIQFMRASDRVALSPPKSGALDSVIQEVQAAVAELKQLIPEGWQLEGDKTSPTDEEVTSSGLNFGLADKNTKTIKLMLGALAWVDNTRDRLDLVNQVVVHEAWHAVEDFIAPKTRQMLVETAKKAGVLNESTERTYRDYLGQRIAEMFPDMSEADKSAMVERYIDNEHVAALVDSNHDGFRHGDVADSILDRISAFFERIGNMLRGRGFVRAEDVLHEFYRGEITDRVNKINQRRRTAEAQVIPPEKIVNVEGLRQLETNTGYKTFVTTTKDEAGNTTWNLYDAETKANVGYLEVDSKGEIQMLSAKGAKGKGLGEAILRYAERERGEPFKTAQVLTQQGYNFLNRRAPERVKFYVKDAEGGVWLSPKHIWEDIEGLKARLRKLPTVEDVNREWWGKHLKERIAYMEGLAKQIPEMAKDDPALGEQWVRRSVQMNEWQKDAARRNSELSYRVTGDELGGNIEDPYVFLKRQQEQEHEQIDGYVPQPEMLSIRGVFRRYGDRNPEVRRHIRGTTRGTEQDRTYTIQLWGNRQIALGKKGLMIRQLAWLNPHIPQLRDYVSWRDQQNQRRMQWISRAGETAHSWDSLPRDQADRVSDMMFWATEMRYRTPAEVQNRVLRNPSQAEIAAYARQHQISREGLQQYARVMNDFSAFLNDMQRVFSDQIQRRFATNPVQMNTELARLAADMNRLRSRPYFPMVRFGKYSVTARDPNNRRVLHFSLHPTLAERDAAAVRYAQQNPLHDVQIAEVPESVLDFMGLPGPMLERIKAQLPGISPQQSDWLDRFSQLMAPENSFRKRWLERQGTPGYSLDGIRAYAHYFRSGASYLSRIEFHDQIRDTLRDLDQSVARAADGTSRAVIADTLRTHARDMDTAGKDWVKLKALTFLYQLGFSPVSALMNLTQVPVVSYPYLSNLFGERTVLELGHNVARAGARTLFTRSMQHLQSVPGLQAAHEEMVRQGRIDIGQAAELGTFAESSRIDQTYLGARAQEALRNVSYWGAWMFGQTERFNREWLFETAYKLALQNPNHRHVIDLTTAKHRDWADVMGRTGMTAEQASAFLVAREAVDRTQFVYQSWDRPKWLRGPVAQATRIYFMYTQQMMFALANNPGRFKQLLIMGALYGAMGLPGADDLDALVHYMAVKVFGKDFNLKKAARQFVRDHTEGTIFDKTGPDLFLHGISRYGFGLSLLGEHMGWPQFDVSANGSMGNIIPGFADMMNGLANAGADPDAYKNTATKVLQDVAGPGLGVFFPWMQYMASAPYSGDQAQWQKVLPRSLRAMVDAYRTAQAGGLTAPNGAVTQKLDWSDPADRSTIIAQALGMRPRVANESYEAYEIENNTKQFYAAKKLELAADLTRALRLKDTQAANAVVAGIRQYNADVKAAGIPDQSIIASKFVSGIKTRMKNIEKTQMDLPLQKNQYMLQQQTKQLVPGLLESKRVR